MFRTAMAPAAILAALAAAALPAPSFASGLKPTRMTAGEIAALSHGKAGAGTSGLKGVELILLSGNPGKPGLYALELRVPAHTHIAAHTHRDDRTALVVSGEWHFGYGKKASDKATTVLGPGGFYTEPADTAHFAFTGDKPTVVYITGEGPTDTNYVDPADTPAAAQ